MRSESSRPCIVEERCSILRARGPCWCGERAGARIPRVATSIKMWAQNGSTSGKYFQIGLCSCCAACSAMPDARVTLQVPPHTRRLYERARSLSML